MATTESRFHTYISLDSMCSILGSPFPGGLDFPCGSDQHFGSGSVPPLRPPLLSNNSRLVEREIRGDIEWEGPARLPTMCRSLMREGPSELPPIGRSISMAE